MFLGTLRRVYLVDRHMIRDVTIWTSPSPMLGSSDTLPGRGTPPTHVPPDSQMAVKQAIPHAD